MSHASTEEAEAAATSSRTAEVLSASLPAEGESAFLNAGRYIVA